MFETLEMSSENYLPQYQSQNLKLIDMLIETPLIEYLVKKSEPQTREETLQQTEECLRYLYLSHFVPGNIPIAKKVDDIWHLLILETHSYFELCQKLPSKKYKHHQSAIYKNFLNPNKEKAQLDKEAKRNLEWLVSYVANFGNFTPSSAICWPYVDAIMTQLNLDLESLNQKLKSLIK